MLTFEVASEGSGEVVVALHGDLAGENWTHRLAAFLEEHYIDDGVERIRLDASDVRWIDLEGVATLVVLSKEADRVGKVLTVERLQEQPAEKLRQVGVLRLLGGPAG